MASTVQISIKPPRLNQFTQVGRLLFDRFWPTAGTADPYGLWANFEWNTGKGLDGHQGTRWIWLEGEFTSARASRRRFGSLLIPTDHLPPLDPGSNWSLQWLWRLTPEEVEAIEADRAADPLSAPYFYLNVRGIIELDGACHTVEGDGQISVALSDWQQQLVGLGYGIPPSTAGLAGLASTAHPSWVDAGKKLGPAREALRAGDGHQALAKCLGEFEALVTKPYLEASWSSWLRQGFTLDELPEQKATSVARLLSGHCSFLNRVGHHRDREPQDPTGELLRMPLGQWEAELIVGATQLLLAYALRLNAGRTAKIEAGEAS